MMMVRSLSVVTVVLAVLASAVPARAGSMADRFRAFAHSVAQDFKRNNCWPDPFVQPDRYSVRAPFAVMVHNGWRRQNMLSDHHFEEDLTSLNEAGRLKVQWIMTIAPRHHRTIYIQQAETAEGTEARAEAVQQYAVRFVEGDQLPEVIPTSIDASGWPASRVDMIDRAWVESAPAPRMPEPQSDYGGGSN